MKLNSVLTQGLYDVIKACAEINKLGFTKVEFDAWCETINAINALTYGKANLGDNYALADYQIPEALSLLIYPVRVGIKTGAGYVNFRVYDKADESKILDPMKFTMISVAILSSRRVNSEGKLKPVSGFRTEVTLESIIERSFAKGEDGKGTVRYGSTYVWPIELTTAFLDPTIGGVDSETSAKEYFLSTYLSFGKTLK